MDEKVMLDEQTSVIVINRASVSNATGMIKAKEDRFFKKSLEFHCSRSVALKVYAPIVQWIELETSNLPM